MVFYNLDVIGHVSANSFVQRPTYSPTTDATTSLTTTPEPTTTNKPLMECEGIILSACEVNNCPKQVVSGLSHPGVCQISCDAVGEKDCSSWSYYENEKVICKKLLKKL